MLHRHILEFVDRLLQDLQLKSEQRQLFGGKIVILGADWKQLAPVVEGGGRYAIIDASIKSSPLLKEFQHIEFTRNMRTQATQVPYRILGNQFLVFSKLQN